MNQRNLDATYVDSFGNTHTVQQRQDMQLQKFFAPFSGWFLTPKFRYYLYVWSSNASQGDPAQVVGAGNLSYTFNRFVTVGAGITSLPTVRSTEGQFPYWLGVDDRLIADEFFRGSYTTGVWLKGEVPDQGQVHGDVRQQPEHARRERGADRQQVRHAVLHGAVAADDGRVRPVGTVRRLRLSPEGRDAGSACTTRTASRTSRASRAPNGIENSQIRLTDGSVIFTPDLFGPGITVNEVDYQMTSLDAGIKYKGLSLEGEYYRRWLSDFTGVNTGGIADITDNGYQLQSSAMVVPEDPPGVSQRVADLRPTTATRRKCASGENWYFMKERGLRLNAEWMHVNKQPGGIHRVSVSRSAPTATCSTSTSR